MRLGIFGGAFDPIHTGHIMVSQQVLQAELVDKVLIMPCYKSMFGKKMAAPAHRLAMVMLVANQYEQIEPFDFEIKYRLHTDTYSIMRKIEEKLYKDDLYFIIGQDNANKMTFWGHSEQIINEIKFIVIPRSGYPSLSNPWYTKEPHVYLKDAEIKEPISSSLIRKYLKNKNRLIKPHHLDDNVYQYIEKFGLYTDRYR